MAAHDRGAVRSVAEDLFESAWQFDFYQAVRLLEMLSPGKEPVGRAMDPADDAVRFSARVSLAFPGSDVEEIRESGADGPAEMVVSFMGLAGVGGPLPAPYTELILERVWRKDTALRDFLDIFNHRLVSLMYRVARTRRPGFDFVSPEKGRFARCLFSLMGMRTEGLRDRMRIRDRSLLFYTGILAQTPRSVTGLEAILSDYFQVPVRGRSFAGKWYDLEEDQVTRLGISGQNRALGESALIGSRVWDQQGKFELHIGPLALAQLLDFLPTGTAFTPLCQLARFYVGTESDYDIFLIPDSGKTVQPGLGGPEGSRLGWTSWLSVPGTETEFSRVRLTSCVAIREEASDAP
ncbi:type VI secretion system baseplate subunit TssG [Desulfonema ishimotonii]|uniref:Type VI secretion system baseplate subunit TssG n=2 Tax=Desulfonema ishimotonii TaxID=45657 RepID=A0A401FYU3_9BACT|nr:type VI secretion system baseplate subunit TssG [Desulfonema ishimotonii]